MNTTDTPDHHAWAAWHPTELADRLTGLAEPWCIVGGWALDLWHGQQTRHHDDLEFTILRGDFPRFRDRLKPMRLYTAGDGVVDYLPDGQNPPSRIFQIWCRDIQEPLWRVDMMIEPGTRETWVYKRDSRVARPRTDMVDRTDEGLCYLKPTAVLLFKAKYRRDKDEIDFANALPKLDAVERAWLKDSLDLVHPGHEWARAL